MSEPEALETAAVNSVCGQAFDPALWRQRPYRAPHHTATAASLAGGGNPPAPGEISRAHNGVLFLDELAEFRRSVLEVLREPIERGRITISRARRQAEFPARFQLVAAMNPCPCGYRGDDRHECRCTPAQIAAYRGRISGPFLDRIDIGVEVSRVPPSVLGHAPEPGEASRDVARRVRAARRAQSRRAGKPNGRLTTPEVTAAISLDGHCRRLLAAAADRMALSLRACHRIVCVARTIADLDDADTVAPDHLAEAISFRNAIAEAGRLRRAGSAS
jgi:magnesium chelatase family protein